MSWQKELRVKTNQPLKDKTTLKIAGPAEFFSEPKGLPELKLLINKAKENNLPLSIIGAGSNLLISDRGVKGLLIKLNSPHFKKISLKDNYIEAGSGVMLFKLIQCVRKRSLSGIEFLSGIPGTLGGALAMNAGCWGKNIEDLVEEVKVMDYKGKVRRLNKRKIKFGYRESGLGEYIILSAVLKLKRENAQTINRNIKDYILRRRNSQDLTFPSAGCIFKNPASSSAGRLIELCGLKGRRIGGASISTKHANFILNKGNAKAEDVLKLIRLARERVKKRFKVTLELEIKIWE